jgi:hypothetical protein
MHNVTTGELVLVFAEIRRGENIGSICSRRFSPLGPIGIFHVVQHPNQFFRGVHQVHVVTIVAGKNHTRTPFVGPNYARDSKIDIDLLFVLIGASDPFRRHVSSPMLCAAVFT